MKYIIAFLILFSSTILVNAQITFPSPHDLSSSDFSFNGFASGLTTAYPTSIRGYEITKPISTTSTIASNSNMVANTAHPGDFRIRNEISNGVSFNTNVGRRIGAIILAINTLVRDSVSITFSAENIFDRTGYEYAVRLQYRVGTSGSFQDVNGGAIQYNSGLATPNGRSTFTDVLLPEETWGEAVVQLRWIYFIVQGNDAVAGWRDRITIDDISVSSVPSSVRLLSSLRGSTLNLASDSILFDTAGNSNLYQFQITGGLVNETFYTTLPWFKFNRFDQNAGFRYNETYSVSGRPANDNGGGDTTFGAFGAIETVSTPATIPDTKLRTAFCNITIPSPSSLLLCDFIAFAEEYEWRVNGGGLVNEIRSRNNTANPSKTASTGFSLGAFGAEHGQTYQVEIRAKAFGLEGAFNTICNVTISSAVPDIQLRSFDCDIVASDRRETFYLETVPGATEYWVWITDASTVTIDSFAIPNGKYHFKLAAIPAFLASQDSIKPNTLYNVQVRARVPDGGGGFFEGSFGNTCTFTTPSVLKKGLFTEDYFIEDDEFSFKVYPNPGDGRISISDGLHGVNSYNISVINSLGKMVYSQESASTEENIDLSNLRSGVYMIQVENDDQLLEKIKYIKN